ncbi:MAG: hypothetical protein R3D29_15155 [Nitratireductor sp.]
MNCSTLLAHGGNFCRNIIDKEIAGAPATAKRDVIGLQILAQSLGIMRHSLATLDADIADLARLAQCLLHRVVGSEIRQVIILPGNRGNTNLYAHDILCLKRLGDLEKPEFACFPRSRPAPSTTPAQANVPLGLSGSRTEKEELTQMG